MINFIQKITGAMDIKDDEYDEKDDERYEEDEEDINFDYDDLDDVITDIPIDIYEDDKNVFLRCFLPGIEPEQIDISLSRSSVSISGERIDPENIDPEYFEQKELIWGRFEKRILLPNGNEVDVDRVRASAKNGLLVLKMPKIDKDRTVKISL